MGASKQNNCKGANPTDTMHLETEEFAGLYSQGAPHPPLRLLAPQNHIK